LVVLLAGLAVGLTGLSASSLLTKEGAEPAERAHRKALEELTAGWRGGQSDGDLVNERGIHATLLQPKCDAPTCVA
jgi:hypothetical protein